MSDPDRIRTYDPQLRRLLLYPLSYEALNGCKDIKTFLIFSFNVTLWQN